MCHSHEGLLLIVVRLLAPTLLCRVHPPIFSCPSYSRLQCSTALKFDWLELTQAGHCVFFSYFLNERASVLLFLVGVPRLT